MIILSEETLNGGVLINNKRISHGLKPLDIFPITLIEDDIVPSEYCEERKVSSSNYRMRLLGTLLKPPQVNSNKEHHMFSISY